MLKIAAICLVACLVSLSARAQVLQFADRTLYNNASTGNTIVDFTGHIQGLAPSITIAPDTFSGLNGSQVEVIDGTKVGQAGNAVLALNTASFNTDSVRIDLPVGTTAFGTDFKTAGNGPIAPAEGFLFTLFNGATSLGSFAAVSSVGSSLNFVGFTSQTPITAVQVQVTGAIGVPEPILDNVTTGVNAVAIPEPHTGILLMLTAAAIFGGNIFSRPRIG